MMQTSLVLETQTASDTPQRRELIASYRADAEAFFALAAQDCPALLERNPAAWNALDLMPLEHVSALARSFEAYRDVCEKEVLEEGRITSIQLAWRMMKRLGLRPPSNLMAMLRESDVIEIYDLGLHQIFRNLNFFNVTSYTFEDLMHTPLAELFARPPHINEPLFNEIKAVFSGEVREAFYSQVPLHRAEERYSRKKLIANFEQRAMAPLFNSTGHVLAILASSDVKIIGQGAMA